MGSCPMSPHGHRERTRVSITTLWRQGTDPSSPCGVRGWIHHLPKDPATLHGSIITLGRQGLDPSSLHRDRGWICHPPMESGTKPIPLKGCMSLVPQALLPKDTGGFLVLSQATGSPQPSGQSSCWTLRLCTETLGMDGKIGGGAAWGKAAGETAMEWLKGWC